MTKFPHSAVVVGIASTVVIGTAMVIGLGFGGSDTAFGVTAHVVESEIARSSMQDPPPDIRRDDSGVAVGEWQILLNRWLAARTDDDGFRLVVDGVFGPLTDAVTRSLQHESGESVDGIVGPRTRAAYARSPALPPTSTNDASNPLLASGDRSQAVQEWQALLNRWSEATRGSSVAIDGVFGRLTERMTREFQSAHGITVDGIVGPETRTAMRNVSSPGTGASEAAVPGDPGGPAIAESVVPASGICPDTPDPVVTIRLGDSLAEPRCIAVRPDQRLRVVNTGSSSVTYFLAEHWIILWPNNASVIDLPFDEYLEPGVHTIHVDRYGGAGPQLWMRP